MVSVDTSVIDLTGVEGVPANTKHLYNIYTTPAQRRRRDVGPTLYKYYTNALCWLRVPMRDNNILPCKARGRYLEQWAANVTAFWICTAGGIVWSVSEPLGESIVNINPCSAEVDFIRQNLTSVEVMRSDSDD